MQKPLWSPLTRAELRPMCLWVGSLLVLGEPITCSGRSRAHSTPSLAQGNSMHPPHAAVLGDSCAHLSLSLIQEDRSTLSTRPSSGRLHAHSLLSSTESMYTHQTAQFRKTPVHTHRQPSIGLELASDLGRRSFILAYLPGILSFQWLSRYQQFYAA